MAKVYWIDKDAIAFADSDAQGNLSGPTSGTATFHCSRHDAPFVSAEGGSKVSNIRIEHGMKESPVIPVEFHEMLTYKAIAHGYEKKGELKIADYFHKKFAMAVADGKKEANSHKSEESAIEIIGTDF
jgi:hypothetical protein